MGETSSGLPTVGEVPNDPESSSFENLGNDFSDFPEETQAAPEAPKAPVAPVVPPPVAPPVVAAPKVVPPVAAAAGIQQPEVAAAPQAQQPPATDGFPANVDEVITALQNPQGNIIDGIMPAFQLTEDQIQGLESDATTEVPKLLAQTYMRAVTTSLQYMKTLIPEMIRGYNDDQSLAQNAEKEFFTKFSSLNATNHGDDIIQYAKAFAATNPQITKQQLFDLVGAAVMAKNGIANQPAAVVRGNARPAPAFTPAGRSAPIIAQTVVEESPFQGLGMEFD